MNELEKLIGELSLDLEEKYGRDREDKISHCISAVEVANEEGDYLLIAAFNYLLHLLCS